MKLWYRLTLYVKYKVNCKISTEGIWYMIKITHLNLRQTCINDKMNMNDKMITWHNYVNFKLSCSAQHQIKVSLHHVYIKKDLLINQRSNWSPRLYCKYTITDNTAKVIGTRPKTIPIRKLDWFQFVWKNKKRRNHIYFINFR